MRRRIVLIVAAALLALTGTGAVWVYVAGADARALAGKQTVTVLVAADAIPSGVGFAEAQRQGLVETASFPRGAVPVGAFTMPARPPGWSRSGPSSPTNCCCRRTSVPRTPPHPRPAGSPSPPARSRCRSR